MPTLRSLRQTRWQRMYNGALLGCLVALFVLLVWAGKLFTDWRLRLNDVYFTPIPVSNNIVIIAIDDASLARYGRSLTEWSRTVYADLMRILTAAQARVVAFDILFADPSDQDDTLAEAIQAARTSEARIRVVMPVVGIQRSTDTSAVTQSIRFQDVLMPTGVLRDVADYLGYVNAYPDVDSTIRHQPSLIQQEGQPGLSFGIATYLAYLRIPSAAVAQLVKSGENTLQITSERQLRVDENGFWIQNFFGPPHSAVQSTFPVVSFQDVVAGHIEPTLFDDKIVLVGVLNASTLTDWYLVPSSTKGQMMAGVEIHANAVETLIQNQMLSPQSDASQILLIIAFAVVASTIYAHLRWYWMLGAAALMLFSWVVIVFLLFNTKLEVINLFHPALALVLPVIPSIGVSIRSERKHRQKAEFLLDRVVEVSGLHLVLEKVLTSIAEDIQRLLGPSAGGIWIRQEDNDELKLAYHWSTVTPALKILSDRIRQEQRLIIDEHRIGIPLVWQQRQAGTIAVELPSRRKASNMTLELLQEFALRVAPNLENAILHSQIQRQRNLVEAVLLSSPAGILVLDDQLHIVRSNTILGNVLPLNSSPERSLIDRLRAENVSEETLDAIQAGFLSGKTFRRDIQIRNNTFNFDAAPLKDWQQWVVVLNDVTALAELSKLKTRLMRLATHDLKNPLGRVLGYGSIILGSRDDLSGISEQSQRFIQEMFNAAQDMNRIINDILNSEQIRSSEFPRETVDLSIIANQVVVHFKPALSAKRLQMATHIEANLPQISGNTRYLHQVITNLISNAVKYTPEDGYITLRLYPTDERTLRLEVADTGYGMSVEGQRKLFSEFYRIRTAATAHITGTGLGLSLSKWIIEAHGGQIWVESEEGIGSTFFIELPTIQEREYADTE